MPEPLADPNVRLLALVDLLLVLKMIALANYTSFLRLRRRVYATPEDYAMRAATPPARPDEDIERVRRAHRNDLENILPFFVVSFLTCSPSPRTAPPRSTSGASSRRGSCTASSTSGGRSHI